MQPMQQTQAANANQALRSDKGSDSSLGAGQISGQNAKGFAEQLSQVQTSNLKSQDASARAGANKKSEEKSGLEEQIMAQLAGQMTPVSSAKPRAQAVSAQAAQNGEKVAKANAATPNDQSIASLTTGGTQAGLKPWSGKWVFGQSGSLDAQNSVQGQDLAQQLSENGQPKNPSALLAKLTQKPTGNELAQAQLQNPSAAALDPRGLNSNTKIDLPSSVQIEEITVDSPQSSKKGMSLSMASGGLSGAEFLEARNSIQSMDTKSAGNQRLKVIDGGLAEKNPMMSMSDTLAKDSLIAKPVLSSKSKNNGFGLGEEQFKGAHELQSGGSFTSTLERSTLAATPATILNGHVTQGAMGQSRLSTDALTSMSSSIRNMNAQGGGEMRIRLKPENLGELHVRVMTNGKDVGLQIQASDEQAKKIIEESMSHLKDNLASQSLTLSQVDVSVTQPSDRGEANANHQGQSGRGLADQTMHGNSQQQSQGQGREASGSEDTGRPFIRNAALSQRAAAGGAGSRSMNASASGRVDLMA